MLNFKLIVILAAVAALADYVWLGTVMSGFYKNQLGDLLRPFGISFDIRLLGAVAVYLLLALGILYFVLPLASSASTAFISGALFGLVSGSIVVSFASTIGATLACFVSRYVLRDWVQGKFGDKLKIVNEGFEKEGAFYLFSLRLIVVVPFWLINLVMGLTKIRLRTFFWVSQLGMIPGTIVVVNAGKELGKIEKMSGFFSPGLIISLALLGLFPIVTKKLLSLYKQKRGQN